MSRQSLTLESPTLWSCDNPALYNAVVSLLVSGMTVDACDVRFGIRECRFDPQKGFSLNGKPLKIKGLCCHEGHACVGTAVPYAVNEFRISKLKEIGCNAYRTAHNPPSPDLRQIIKSISG